jgi:hypothetical protein
MTQRKNPLSKTIEASNASYENEGSKEKAFSIVSLPHLCI